MRADKADIRGNDYKSDEFSSLADPSDTPGGPVEKKTLKRYKMLYSKTVMTSHGSQG